ncbi:MAG: TerB family tellurite resistance protein [Woeseia sp.]|nr:TerB family tellurite resistance protein [Woeseia sp.]
MLKRLVKTVTDALTAEDSIEQDPAQREQSIRMATAVLMIDVARADNDFHENEFDLLLDLIRQHFNLSADQASDLATAAHEEAEEIVEISRFTQLLHNALSDDEKLHIVNLLWKIAFADGRLSKHEDALVLRISDLLYVSRAKVMRLKHDARPARAPQPEID